MEIAGESALAEELKGLVVEFLGGDSGKQRCSTWWNIHESLALGGSEVARFKVMGAIGALCVWIGRDYTNQEVLHVLSTEEHYEQVAEQLPALLDIAREPPTRESSAKLGDMIWEYITANPKGNARLMFGALISMMRPLLEKVREDVVDTIQIVRQELIDAADKEDVFKRVWSALMEGDGDMILQMHAIIALTKAAIAKKGPAQYPGNVNVDACGFIGYQIATLLSNGDDDLAKHTAAVFLMTVPPDHSYQLAHFLAQHAQ